MPVAFALITAAFAASPPTERACPPTALAEAMQRVGQVKSAHLDADITAFDHAATALAQVIPCAEAPATAAMALDLHHAMGLRAFANQDALGAQRSLGALRELAPDWRPNETWMVPGNPIYELYLLEIPPEVVPLADRPPGGWLVDGAPATAVPGHRAFLLQALGRRGEVVYTGYHAAPSTLPEFDFPNGQAARTVRTFGTVASAALAVGAAATGVGAWSASQTARVDDTLSSAETVALLERGRALGVVTGALGAAASVGLVVTWAVPW